MILIIAIGTQPILFVVIGVTGNALIGVDDVQVRFKFFRRGRGHQLAGRRRKGHRARCIMDCQQWGRDVDSKLASHVASSSLLFT